MSESIYYRQWKALNGVPGESESDSIDRFTQQYNLTEFQRQRLKDENEGGFQYEAPKKSGMMAQLGAGVDELQKAAGLGLQGPLAQTAEDAGFEGVSQFLEDIGGDIVEQQEQDLQQYAAPQTREELIEEGGFLGSLYENVLPEELQTPEQFARQVVPSLGAAGGALGAGGVALLASGGNPFVAGATSMAVGNILSSIQVAGEEYSAAKENPILREQLGIPADVEFRNLTPQQQNSLNESAQRLAKEQMVERTYTSGLLESLSFIPFGPAALRFILDIGLGATSEELDKRLGAENVADELVRLGVPESQHEELRQRLLGLRPGTFETVLNAAVMEGIASAPVTAAEALLPTDSRVDKYATASKNLKDTQAKAQEVFDEKKHKRDLQRQKERREELKTLEAEQNAEIKQIEYQQNKDELNKPINLPQVPTVDETKSKLAEAELKPLMANPGLLRVAEIQRNNALEAIEADAAKLEEMLELDDLPDSDDPWWNELEDLSEAEQAREYNQRVESQERAQKIVEDLGRLDELNQTLYDRIANDVKKKDPNADPDALIREYLSMEQDRVITQEARDQEAREQAAIDQGFAESEARTEGVIDPQTQLLPSFSSKKKTKKAAQAAQEAVSKVDELLNPGQTIDDVPDSQFEVNSFTAEEHQDLIDFINGVFPQFTFEGATAAMTEDGQVGSFFTNSEGRQTFMPGEDSFAAEGFVLSGKDKIYMTRRMTRPDGSLITDPKEAVNRFVEVAFHEGIGHFGLRKMFDAGTQLVDKDGKEVESKRFTGEKYNRIIDGFYRKNKKEIDAWPEYQNEPVFRRTEEFIARKFGETGAGADLNIADKLEVAIRNALPVLRDRIGAAQMAKIIKDVQAEYLNAPEGKSIVTGDPLAGAAKQGSAELTEDENAQLQTLRARKRQREVEKLRSLDPKTQQDIQSKKRSELATKIRGMEQGNREKVMAFFNRNPDAEVTDAQIQKILQRGVKGTKNKKKGVPLKVPAEKKVKTKEVKPKTAGQEVKKLTKKQSDAEIDRIIGAKPEKPAPKKKPTKKPITVYDDAEIMAGQEALGEMMQASYSRRDSDYDRFRSFGGKTPLRRYDSGRSDKNTAFGAKFDVDKELGLALRTKSWPMALVQDLINFDRLNSDYAKGLRASLQDKNLGKAEKKLANLVLARGREGYVKQKKAQLTRDQKRELTAAPSGYEKNGSKWEGLGKPENEIVTNAKRVNILTGAEGISFSTRKRDRNPILLDANTKLRNGEIDSIEHQRLIDQVPIVPMEAVPDLPNYDEMNNALEKTGKGKAEKGILGFKGKSMADFDGTMVGARLDIAAYNKYGVYIATLHDKKQGGNVLVYSQTALLENVEFSGVPDAALNIGIDKDKTTIARMWGKFKKHNSKLLAARAKRIMDGKEKGWQQVGMNPDRGSYFYLMDGTPLIGAKEVIQIGKLVLAKGVETTTRMDPRFQLTRKGSLTKTAQEGATFSKRKVPLTEVGFAGVKGQDIIGRDIPVWPGSIVVHSTDQEGLADISKGGYRVVGDGYYGKAVSFTTNILYSRSFGGETTVAQLSDDIKILNDNDPKDAEKIRKIWGNRPDGRKMHQQMLDAGYDGIYDPGAGDLFIYNPAKVKMIGTPEDANYSEGATFSTQAVREAVEKHGLIPNEVIRGMMGSFPEYLRGVMGAMEGMRKKVFAGKVKPRDVAKAWLITVGSMGADAMTTKRLFEKINFDIPEMFIHEGKVRPEEMVAAWFGSSKGQKFLNKIDQGKFDEKLYKDLLDNRDAYGGSRLTKFELLDPGPEKRKTLRDITAMTAVINKGKDAKAVDDAFANIKGVGIGKEGFIRHFLGFGTQPTIDAVEINAWLTGQGDISNLDSERAEWARMAKKATPKFLREMRDMVREQFDIMQRDGFVTENIAPEAFQHIMHHWLWDRMKGLETTHKGLYHAMATFSTRDLSKVPGEGEHGQVVGEGTFDTVMAETLGAAFSLSQADVDALKDVKFMKNIADRMASGKYRPRDPNNPYFKDIDSKGRYYMMKGGLGYPMMAANLAKRAVWAADGLSIMGGVINMVAKGFDHMLVTVGNPDQNLGNTQFWDIYIKETQWDLDKGVLSRKDLNDRIGEFIKKNKDGGYPGWVKAPQERGLINQMAQAKGRDNWEKLVDIHKNLVFAVRNDLVKKLGGDIFTAKNPTNFAAPLSQIHGKTIVYPNAKKGDIVGIIKLDPANKQKRNMTASDVGVPEHEGYQYVLLGEPIAMVPGTDLEMEVVFKNWLTEMKKRAAAEYKDLNKQVAQVSKDIRREKDKKEKAKLKTKKEGLEKRKSTVFRQLQSSFKTNRDNTYKRYTDALVPFTLPEEVLQTFEYPATPTSFSLRRAAATHSLNTPTPGAGGIRGGLLRLVKKIEPLQNIKKRDEYLKMRAKLLGKLDRWQDMGRTVYDALVDSKNTKAIYDYLTTKGASSSMIPDVDERRAAESAKMTIRKLGQALVDRNLLKQETQEKFKDAYLPRVYLQYLLNEEDRNTIAAGRALKPSAMKYLNQRKDIPKGIRELILGEITDQEGAPAYLASRTMLQQGRDISIIDWLGQLATTSMANGWDWVVPESVVSFNTLEEIKKAAKKNKANASQLIKDLDLGRDLSQYYADVTPFWLQQEAERLRTQIAPTMDGAKKAVVNDLAAAMEKAGIAGAQTADQVIATGDYKQIPKSRRYGMMAGMVVHKEIADDILGAQNIVTADDSLLDQVIGNGGKLDKFVNYWKWSKVAANPPAWARNMISNMILLNLSGVPLVRMPDLVFSTLRDFSNQGKYYQIAKDQGLVSGNMSSAELGRVEREFNNLMRKMNKDKKGTPMKVFGALKGAFEKVQEGTSDIYSGLETFGKMMAIKYAMETGVKEGGIMSKRVKLDAADAAQYANKWLFDYGLVRPSVRTARNKLVPFMTFQAKALPLMAEVALTRPWAFAPYFALGYGMIGLFKSMFDLEDEEYESMKLGLQDWLREKSTPPELFGIPLLPPNAIPLPYLDQNNKVQFQDISYLFPWGLFSEVISEIGQGKFADAFKSVGLMGGPVFSVTTAISTGIDPFTRKEIVDPLGTPTEKAADVLKYVYNMVSPQPIHWDSGAFKRFAQGITEEIDPKTGEVKITMPQAFGRLAGQNVYSINLQESRRSNMRRLEYEMANLIRKMNRELKGLRNQKKPISGINELRDDYLERLEKLREEYKEYGQTSKIPAQLRRAG